jgi:hypothetical protein
MGKEGLEDEIAEGTGDSFNLQKMVNYGRLMKADHVE